MTEPVDLPVIINGHQRFFKAQLLKFGFVYKFKVDVKGQEVIFEPDEERNCRAIVDPQFANELRQSDINLLQHIAEALHGQPGNLTFVQNRNH